MGRIQADMEKIQVSAKNTVILEHVCVIWYCAVFAHRIWADCGEWPPAKQNSSVTMGHWGFWEPGASPVWGETPHLPTAVRQGKEPQYHSQWWPQAKESHSLSWTMMTTDDHSWSLNTTQCSRLWMCLIPSQSASLSNQLNLMSSLPSYLIMLVSSIRVTLAVWRCADTTHSRTTLGRLWLWRSFSTARQSTCGTLSGRSRY